MAERITKQQFANALNFANITAHDARALRDGETIGTAHAWTMGYVCVYGVDGAMVRALSNPMPTRGLYDYIRALSDGFRMVADVRTSLAVLDH